MATDVKLHLGRDAEDRVLRLLDGYDLGEGFELACVIGPSEAARAEVAARLSERGRLTRLQPGPAIVHEVNDALPAVHTRRPIVWVEAQHFTPALWTTALAAMNGARDRLRDRIGGLLVLAGPPELLTLIHERVDLVSVLSAVVRVEHAPTATAPLDLRWLHLSDLHFTADQKWERRTTLTSLIDHVRDTLVPDGLRPDLVLVTGDIAQSGKKAEYDQAEDFFIKLMDAAGLEPRKHLFLVPGNHDVDRGRLGRVGRMISQSVLKSGDQGEIEETLSDSTSLAALGERLEAFYTFTRQVLGPARGWTSDLPWRNDRIDVRGFPVGLVQLNSAWASGDGDARDRLLVGMAQVQRALAELPDVRLRVALVHHPPDWLAAFDGKPLERHLASESGVDFLLHGHVHDEDTFVREGPGGRLMVLSAATAYVKGHWDKGCSLVTLNGAAGQGEIRYYAFSDRDEGFWNLDTRRYKKAKDGIWTFPLPASLRDGPDAAEPRTAGPIRPDEHAAQVARYRSQAASVHGRVSFVGMPDRAARAIHATVAELFAPLLALPRGAPDPADEEVGTPVADLVQALLETDAQGNAGRLVLLGEPGSGKTTLTRYLTVWAAGGLEIEGVERPERLVPLRIPFREYLQDLANGTCTEPIGFLVQQAEKLLNAPLRPEFFEQLLGEGRALVLFDGLDEVSDPAQREQTSLCVLSFADKWGRSPMLVTSRIVGYDDAALPERHPPQAEDTRSRLLPRRFTHLELRRLTSGARAELVRRWYHAQIPHDAREREQRTSDLLAALEVEVGAQKLARNPLLATLVCLVHRQEATLPGQRVELYDKVVHTLLHSRPEATDRAATFRDIERGLQRAYLQALAYRMQRRRAQAEVEAERSQERHDPDEGRADVTIGRRQLIEELTDIARKRGLAEDIALTRDRMERWVRWLAARTGLLVEKRPGVFEFLHLTLMEYLAACAWTEQAVGEGGVRQLVDALSASVRTAAMREPSRMVMGLHANDFQFVEAATGTLLSAGLEQQVLLLEGLLEELAVPPPDVRRLLAALIDRSDWARDDTLTSDGHIVSVLVHVARFSEIHGETLRQLVAEQLLQTEAVRPLPTSLLEAIPRLVPDSEAALAVIDHLRSHTSDGDQLFFLYSALDETAVRWPQVAEQARALQGRFFDHLAEPPRGLFETVDAKEDDVVDLWRNIRAGTFLMGSPEGKGYDDEWPQHEVTLSQPFQMAAVTITNRQYAAFDPLLVPKEWKGVDDDALADHPRVNVSWYAAMSFCRWLSSRAKWARGARLPTEAEWEYACRAGSPPGQDYFAGEGEAALDQVGWYAKNSKGRTHRVAQKDKNLWGLYDVHGNVWEWTSDTWLRTYAAEPATDPTGPAGGVRRVMRGGSWYFDAGRARAAFRFNGHPSIRVGVLGFRVVLPAPGSRS